MVVTLLSFLCLVNLSSAAVVTDRSYNTPRPAFSPPPPSYSEPAYQEPAYPEPTYKEPTYKEPTYPESIYPEELSYQEPYRGSDYAYGVYPNNPVPKDLKSFVENHLAPHYDQLVCYGLNASYHMHIQTRMALGCNLASDTKPAAANKYSACELSIMKKFVLCNEKDHACYTAHLESLSSCKDSCCKGNPKYCHAAVCRGLARSYVDVEQALAYCKDVLFPLESPKACPFLSHRWLSCRPFIRAAEEVCSQDDPEKLLCRRAALLLGHSKCVACTPKQDVMAKTKSSRKKSSTQPKDLMDKAKDSREKRSTDDCLESCGHWCRHHDHHDDCLESCEHRCRHHDHPIQWNEDLDDECIGRLYSDHGQDCEDLEWYYKWCHEYGTPEERIVCVFVNVWERAEDCARNPNKNCIDNIVQEWKDRNPCESETCVCHHAFNC